MITEHTGQPDERIDPKQSGLPAPATGCRFCGAPLRHTFIDLGHTPLCQSVLTEAQLDQPEQTYPLHAYVCDQCWLVQLKAYVSGESIFGGEYAYFSSYSDSWLAHCERYVEAMIGRFGLDGQSKVVELASNDGYLLQYFVQRGIPALGIEPASNCAAAAEEKGVPTRVAFFGRELATRLASEGEKPDLLVANNVLAHVPDLNDFVGGMKAVLAEDGVITVEFPHLLRLIDGVQFDTIYHEHFCYYSFTTVNRIFAAHGLAVFDVQEIPTHGGSLRVFASHDGGPNAAPLPAVESMLKHEQAYGITDLATYAGFTGRVNKVKHDLLAFLLQAKREGKTVVGYGAPGKASTLMNCCGIRPDLLPYTVDRNTYKQGRYTPGGHIPIFKPDRIRETKPDYVLVLPWNLRDEITQQLAYIRAWGGRCVVPIPELEIVRPSSG
ncbi:MAG: class I SAM-dependent methyltransferase [Planctomycetota bacterium]